MKGKVLGRICISAVALSLLVTAACAQTLVPGGQSIGVAVRTEGVVVIGTSDVGSAPSPARLAGLKQGDVITAIDGVRPESAEDVGRLLHAGECRVTYDRNGREREVMLTPVLSDGAYRLGAWVRDSAAGIGTMTFYDPANGTFGALGHAVTDSDSGIVLPVTDGTIYENTIIGIEKGKEGRPGEILGHFYDGDMLGDVDINSEFGIFGKSAVPPACTAYPAGIETAPRRSVHPGSASILTTVDDYGLREFDCEIVRIEDLSPDSSQSFTINITDKELRSVTGGIVQGMSGSPIIQDGKLVGAVTHVLVNDPTRGYGIFIENMLAAAG